MPPGFAVLSFLATVTRSSRPMLRLTVLLESDAGPVVLKAIVESLTMSELGVVVIAVL